MYASFSYSYFLQKFYLSTFWNSFLTFHFSSTFNSQNYSIYYNSFQRLLLFGLNSKFGFSLLSFSSFPASEERETKGFLFLPPRLEVPVMQTLHHTRTEFTQACYYLTNSIRFFVLCLCFAFQNLKRWPHMHGSFIKWWKRVAETMQKKNKPRPQIDLWRWQHELYWYFWEIVFKGSWSFPRPYHAEFSLL